ncbi:MAG TPA: ABC transporter substrate-binding protein [Alphaproteobacteria bacterium]|jgi:peptide/nickel transport system substrate-binding protein|nr:ABC transporter substrate-binding protein [Alphaproteobacteria bacterium]
MNVVRTVAALVLAGLLAGSPAEAAKLIETPVLAGAVAKGEMPPLAERLPAEPAIVDLAGEGLQPGRHGGDLRMLISRSKDLRLMVVYGYTRLVGYDRNFDIKPDLLKAISVKEGRIFTLSLRRGHRWSDGQPFDSEDFRYYWEDVANNPELSPNGPPRSLLVDGEPPLFEIVDENTVRYSWAKPNPFFLPRLAGASPLFIYRPAHYLKRFHARYAEAKDLAAKAKAAKQRNWAALHNRKDNLYKFDNPDLPTLQPWMNITRPPATRFVGQRNPYFHRVDKNGRQLPYFDRLIFSKSDGKLIPAKAGAGEADLQSRNIFLKDFTFLKENEKRGRYRVLLWRTAKGAHLALYPNLNVNDPVWRKLLRQRDFRRALSLAIERTLINQALYFGLALEHANTVLPDSPLYSEDYAKAATRYDPKAANRLLDKLGLSKRDDEGTRLMPDGRPLHIIVETAGEETEQTDVLELVRSGWAEIGVKLFTKPSQREVFRNRIFSGETVMSIWSGFENGLATPAMSPAALAPTTQQSLQWPKWGQHFETSGAAGEAPDMAPAQELAKLNQAWRRAIDNKAQAKIWRRMLEIHAAETFTIGMVAGVMQPVVARADLMNLPEEGVYNWDPGAQFGLYRPDTFWYKK